ncbi:MAG: oligopeptide/dipeptide ABC transporter ATP-binding protein [Actinomycetes bacterium]
MTQLNEASPVQDDAVLRITDLRTWFPVKSRGLLRRKIGDVKAVDGISLSVAPGETLGLVGESGCGKSTAGRTMLKLIDPTSGSVELNGRDITHLSRKEMVPLRREAQMIFQDPYNSLNPRHTVGTIIGTPFRVQGVDPAGGVKAAVQQLMERVGLNPEHYNRYPNEFSGGQRQRIGVARAIALQPKLIVCDEPVSALDVSIQAQVVNLLADLQDEFGMSYILVAHDLSVVRHISDRVAVMYLGHIMELAPRSDLYERPLHPYTHALLSSVPVPEPGAAAKRERILLQGDLPSPINPPSGCVFNTRCWKVQEQCRVDVPLLREYQPGHFLACHFPEEKLHIGETIVGPQAPLVDNDYSLQSPEERAEEAARARRGEAWERDEPGDFGLGSKIQ